MTWPSGELTTYYARGGHATDWGNPTRSHTITALRVGVQASTYFINMFMYLVISCSKVSWNSLLSMRSYSSLIFFNGLENVKNCYEVLLLMYMYTKSNTWALIHNPLDIFTYILTILL